MRRAAVTIAVAFVVIVVAMNTARYLDYRSARQAMLASRATAPSSEYAFISRGIHYGMRVADVSRILANGDRAFFVGVADGAFSGCERIGLAWFTHRGHLSTASRVYLSEEYIVCFDGDKAIRIDYQYVDTYSGVYQSIGVDLASEKLSEPLAADW